MTRPTIKSVRMQENLDSVFNRQRVEYKLLKSGKSLPVQQEVSKTNQESGLEEDQKNSQSSINEDPDAFENKVCQQ